VGRGENFDRMNGMDRMERGIRGGEDPGKQVG
jgi:hypothetical protein